MRHDQTLNRKASPTPMDASAGGLCREDHGKTKKIVYGITGS